MRHLEDGQFEIDNNLIENTIRPVALGKKNYLLPVHKAAQRKYLMIKKLIISFYSGRSWSELLLWTLILRYRI